MYTHHVHTYTHIMIAVITRVVSLPLKERVTESAKSCVAIATIKLMIISRFVSLDLYSIHVQTTRVSYRKGEWCTLAGIPSPQN